LFRHLLRFNLHRTLLSPYPVFPFPFFFLHINDVSVCVACCVFISDSLSLILCFSAAAHLTTTAEKPTLCRLLVLWSQKTGSHYLPHLSLPQMAAGKARRRPGLACARAQKQITVQEHVLISSNLKRDAIFGFHERRNS